MPFFPTGKNYVPVGGAPIGLGAIALANGLQGAARGRGSYSSNLSLAFWAGYNGGAGAGNTDKLVVIDTDTYVQQSSAPYTYAGSLVYSCAFNSTNGFLYILCTIAGLGRVMKVNALTGALVSTINLPAVMLGDILYCSADGRIYVSGGTGRLVAINNDDSVQDIANLGGNFIAYTMAHVPSVDRIYVTLGVSTNNGGTLLFYNIAAGTFSTVAVPAINNNITALNSIAYSPTAEQCVLGVQPQTSTAGVAYSPVINFDPASDTFTKNTNFADNSGTFNSGSPRGFFYFPATDQFFCLLQTGELYIVDGNSSGFGGVEGIATCGATSAANDNQIAAIVENKFFMSAIAGGSISVFQAP